MRISRRFSVIFFIQNIEITYVIKSRHFADLFNRIIGGIYQRIRISNPIFIEIFGNGCSDILFESIANIGFGIMKRGD